jgi:cytochrome oxidase Cu insertion factor (SCO1/SenC/PrrC family)
LFALAILWSGCRGTTTRVVRAGEFKGDVILQPIAAPDFTLTTTDGQPYHFRQETKGMVGLLFFGYTHCPDICPVHMSNLAAVLRRLPTEVSRKVKVVFVTVDPSRDTPESLRAWLDNFDRSFVGLRGSLDAVNKIQNEFHMPATVYEQLPEGGYALARCPGDRSGRGLGASSIPSAFARKTGCTTCRSSWPLSQRARSRLMQWWCSAQGAPWTWAWRPCLGVWLLVLLIA